MDTLYHNGSIITLDRPLRAGAVLTRDGRVVAAGPEQALIPLARTPLRRVDLKGCALLPAFLDAHSHFAAAANSFLEVPLDECADLEELLERIRDFIRDRQVPPGTWVKAGGYDHNTLAEHRHPTARQLDRAAPDNPLVVQHASGHMGVFNTAALELLDVPARPDAIGGGLIQVEDGRPTGYLEENAFLHYQRLLPMPGREEFLDAFRKAQTLYASHGISTVQEGMLPPQLLGLYQALLEEGSLFLDVVSYAAPADFPAAAAAFPESVGRYDRRFRLGGYKIFLDGSPQGRTAWLREPYAGEDDYRGYPTLTDDQVYDALRLAAREKRQILAHCNGDAACAQLIAAAQRVIRDGLDLPAVRPVMIHAQLLGRDQIPLLKRTGILPSFFAAHIYYWGDVHLDNLGAERASAISPAGSALAAGLPFTFHQDTPVLPPDMLRTLWCAAVRRTRAGTVLGQEERIPVLEALRAVTVHAAWQYGEEGGKGRIAPGGRADFVLLSGDPLGRPPEELEGLKVLATVLQDRVVWRAGSSPL